MKSLIKTIYASLFSILLLAAPAYATVPPQDSCKAALLQISKWQQWRSAPGMIELGKRLVLQPITEALMKRKGADFREGDIKKAYNRMDEEKFDGINARQDWVNWRLIPKALNGRISSGPVNVIDLGCGPGSSTKILAHYINPDSNILGIDLAPNLIARAKKESYCHHSGKTVTPDFVTGSATETFRNAVGTPVAANSVDFVNSSGIVGHYLDTPKMASLAGELQRVVKKGGHASLDNGPSLVAKDIIPIMEKQGFKYLKKIGLFPGDPRGQLVFTKQ